MKFFIWDFASAFASTSHLQHLLVFNEDERRGRLCYGCMEPVFGPSYCCKECRDYLHHKSCAELPIGLHHPSHPNHPLIIFNIYTYDDNEEEYNRYRFIMHFQTLLLEEHYKKKWLCIQSLFCNPHCICLAFVEKHVLGDGSRKSDQSPPWDFILLAYYLIPCGINFIFSWGRSSLAALSFLL